MTKKEFERDLKELGYDIKKLIKSGVIKIKEVENE